jgi:hypothetical protein
MGDLVIEEKPPLHNKLVRFDLNSMEERSV